MQRLTTIQEKAEKMAEYPYSKIKKAVELYTESERLNYSDIARALGVSRQNVARWVKEFKELGEKVAKKGLDK